MDYFLKLGIELIAILMIWIAAGYKRPKEYRLTPLEKGWWVQLILVATALTIIKVLYKY
jgi:hypothetical protein